MANTYYWKIKKLARYTTYESLTGVVHSVDWQMTALSDQTDDNLMPYSSQTSGVYTLGTPSSGSFVDYMDLTPQIVEGWLDSGELDVQEIKDTLNDQINQKINPTEVTESPPW
ncbi:hypothetical protein N9Z65_00425 [bacterium]|nr:hypothetical protein [bacterium]